MLRVASLLRESTQWTDITIENIEAKLSKSSKYWHDRDHERLLEILLDYYHSGDEEKKKTMEGYLAMLNKVGRHIIELTSQIPNVDVGFVKQYLLSQTEFHDNEDAFYPFPVYVSASPNDEMTIGIMMDKSGKVLEIHEGNDEATTETINMVNRMVHPQGKKVRIYASHNTKLVGDIEISEYLPKNLYVSTDRHHASGHMDLHGERSMFTGIIDINSISQESDLDWRTLDKTRIDKFRWL